MTDVDVPLHRLYRHYSELPYSQRVLYTATLLVLGIGYLFAMINLFHTYAGRAGGNPLMLSYRDIVVAYSGSGKGSRLESALRGPMASMLPPDETAAIIAWVQDGADRTKYESTIKADVSTSVCMSCHDGSINPSSGELETATTTSGRSPRLTPAPMSSRWSACRHIHLFGVAFISSSWV
jgi:hypothetical protein